MAWPSHTPPHTLDFYTQHSERAQVRGNAKMGEQQIIENVNEWDRVGRGHELPFYATDQEIQTWLLDILPLEHRPY